MASYIAALHGVCKISNKPQNYNTAPVYPRTFHQLESEVTFNILPPVELLKNPTGVLWPTIKYNPDI